GAVVALIPRQARQQNLAGRQFADLDAAGEQRRAVPLDRAVAQGDPDALVVGDGQFFEGRARGQRPLKAADHHLPPGARQVAFQETGDEAAVILDLGRDLGGGGSDVLIGGLLGGRGRRRGILRGQRQGANWQEQRQRGGGTQRAQQNACPRPR